VHYGRACRNGVVMEPHEDIESCGCDYFYDYYFYYLITLVVIIIIMTATMVVIILTTFLFCSDYSYTIPIGTVILLLLLPL
jgi:hypothetical protein